MPEIIINGSGPQFPWIIESGLGLVKMIGSIVIGSVSAHVDSVYITSGAAPFGYPNNQIIRKDCGSPAVNYVFGEVANAVSIENLGSTPIFFKFDGVAGIGSDSGFLSAFTFRSYDAQVGSISCLGSGAGSPSIQCMRLS
jgi:hypothetical protein